IRTVAPRLYQLNKRLRKKSLIGRLVRGLTRRLVDLFRGRRTTKIWYDLGRCYEQLGNLKQSKYFYDKAVKHSFSQDVQYGGVGALHAREKRWDDALAAFKLMFESRPDLHDLPLRMGHIQRRLGLFHDAFQSYQSALN